MINHGLIEAEDRNGDGSGVLLPGNPNIGGPTNHGLIRANAGGVVEVAATLTQSAVGRLVALDGGGLRFQNGSVVGGSVETVGSAVATVTANSTFENVTSSAAINVPGGGASATLNLRGGHFTNSGFLTVNNTGLGLGATVDILSDLTVQGGGTILLNSFPNSQLRLLGTQRVLTHAAGHTIRGVGQINAASGLLVNHGTVEGLSPTQLIEVNAPIAGTGLLRHVRIDGVHSPGSGVATASVPVEGVYRVNSFGGRVEFELGGTTPGVDYDQLVSSDPTNVVTIGPSATTIDVKLVGGFVPNLGDTFTLVDTAGVISGAFSIENLPAAAPNFALAWDLTYSDLRIVLELVGKAPLPGDYNADGLVDAADYTVWRDTLGSTTNLAADGSGNGVVDSADRGVWAANYGATAAAIATAVPEPVGLLAAACGLAATQRRQAAHRRR